MPAEKALLQIVRSILDGERVDWARAETGADGPTAPLVLDGLRAIDRIAAAFRDLEEPAGDDRATWGPFDLRERVGAGAFAEVFRAWDPRLQREVALKLFREQGPDADADTLREGRFLARVRHPNVVSVHGVEDHGARVGLAMEFVRGRTLAELLTEGGPFGPREAALMGLDLCRALAAFHALDLPHSDVKAQNVMREEGGRVVLMDPGVGFRGTPLYLAPEALAGRATLSPATDLYALGVLLFHLVTGRYPVEGDTVGELRRKHAAGERHTLGDLRPDVPAPFVRAVERALWRDPARRYVSAGTMEAALASALELGPVPVRPRIGTRAAVAGALTAAAGLGLLAFAAWPRVGERPPTPTPATFEDASTPEPPFQPPPEATLNEDRPRGSVAGEAQVPAAPHGPADTGPHNVYAPPATTPAAPAASEEARAASESSPTGEQLLDAALADLAASARDGRARRQRWEDTCHGKVMQGTRTALTPLGNAVQEPITLDMETTPECRMLLADAARLEAEVRQGVETAEEAARRAGVWPGVIRASREKYGF